MQTIGLTLNTTSRFPSKPIQRRLSRLRIPADVVLTSRALIAVGCKLIDAELEVVIEALIAEMDTRIGDPEDEPSDEL